MMCYIWPCVTYEAGVVRGLKALRIGMNVQVVHIYEQSGVIAVGLVLLVCQDWRGLNTARQLLDGKLVHLAGGLSALT